MDVNKLNIESHVNAVSNQPISACIFGCWFGSLSMINKLATVAEGGDNTDVQLWPEEYAHIQLCLLLYIAKTVCNGCQNNCSVPVLYNAAQVIYAFSVLTVHVSLQFEGVAGDEFQEQASQLCSQQSQALELIKNKQRKDPRFAQIIQVHTHTHTKTAHL